MASFHDPVARRLGDLQNALLEFIRLEATSAIVLHHPQAKYFSV